MKTVVVTGRVIISAAADGESVLEPDAGDEDNSETNEEDDL